MNRLAVLVVASLVAVGLQNTSAQSSVQAEKLLASAQRKATVDGDLKGAIEDYKRAVTAAVGNRALSAEALLRMAESYQKLGDGEARAVYERLIRDYADQTGAATLARTRLGATAAVAPVKGDREVWSGREADGFGTISPDGKLLTYTDWNNGSLMVRDLAAGTDRRLTAGTYDQGLTQFSAISKDGRQVAFDWMPNRGPGNERRYELRIARFPAAGIPESRLLYDNPDVTGVSPFDWSPDGKWIAVQVGRADRTIQIALVSVADGSLRVLKSLDWKEPTKIFFSPDGRFIAYDLPVDDTGSERHVFVMAIDGSQETAAAAHASQNVIMGWSPDGRHLLFSSDRTGSFGLWAVPVEAGTASGSPTLVKPDIASSWSLGVTPSGTMYVWKYASATFIQTSALDLTAGKAALGTVTFQRFIGSRGRPDWSPDGKQLAYLSCAPLGSGPCTMWIRSMETGQLRELRIGLKYLFFPRWSPDGRAFLTRGSDFKGRQNGIYRIDAQTGETTLVVSPFLGNALPQWAADGKSMFYLRGSAMVERDLASGTEREALRIPTSGTREFALSPDGRTLAYQAADPAGVESVFVMPMAGGEPKALLQVRTPERLLWRFGWTADGRALAVAKGPGATGQRELWIVPATGEPPRKLDIDVANWRLEDGFRIDLAGKQIAFVGAAGKPGLEIRALENFLPAAMPGTATPKR